MCDSDDGIIKYNLDLKWSRLSKRIPVLIELVMIFRVVSEGGGERVAMENVDMFNAATAPLTFHDFLDRMRHPQAIDLVKSIKR